ncbi:MAG: type II toxin-antitoxin system YafQ family toxin [Aquificae bacterium]|nr:type II toxin-antitoxin system YafQ family toxin [Aquificota bacterium]
MLTLKRHKQFKKDLKKVNLTDKQFEKFIKYISLLLEEKSLPPEAKDHPLVGEWKDFREFHLGGDLLVIYKIEGKSLILVRIGTHNQLFE